MRHQLEAIFASLKCKSENVYILVTVHLRIIIINNQTDAQFLLYIRGLEL